MVQCPSCSSQHVWKDGTRKTKYGEVQRGVCRDCGYRFSQSNPQTLNMPEPVQKVQSSFLNSPATIPSNRQICALEAKNLARVETQQEEALREGTTQTANIKGKLIDFAWWMKKQGYADATIRGNVSCARTLFKRGANLHDPESVKGVIAKQRWSPNRRRNVINAYSLFLKLNGLRWEKPKCKITRKIPFIPTEKELDALIAGCGKKTSTFLQLLKETAMRSGEAKRLRWTDVDFTRQTITLNDPEKGSNPRAWRISAELVAMLGTLPRKSLRIFGDGPIGSLKTTFYRARKRLAAKLQNPRLKRISFNTFGHWKATMLYHKTRDPFYVKNFLGHKSIRSTEIYITIERAIFEPSSDEFTVRAVTEPEEIKTLLEVGFEYVCQKDELVFLRKRK